jgi:hypothetical protein
VTQIVRLRHTREAMLVLTAAAMLAGLLALFVGTKPASAASWYSAKKVDGISVASYTTVSRTCQYTDDFQTHLYVGGKIGMYEGGKKGVEQFRVNFLLYELNSVASPVDASEGRYTYESNKFGNTVRDHYWYPSHTFSNWESTHQYVLRAKMTWVRNNMLDWNKTIDVAVCNNQEGGYVKEKYYPAPFFGGGSGGM